MENDYNFWADLLTTYRSNPDWLKFLWLFIPAVIMTIAGNGLSRLVQRALAPAATPAATPPSPPSPPPPAYVGRLDAQGRVYLEPVTQVELEELEDLRQTRPDAEPDD